MGLTFDEICIDAADIHAQGNRPPLRPNAAG
jgi:hypothetical protein